MNASEYLRAIGVADLPPRTSAFDPGYDPLTLESHLAQSGHLMLALKLSMASWIVADEAATRAKIAAARRYGVPTVTGGGPFEIAVAQRRLSAYLDLCADLGVSRVECGEGFTEPDLDPVEIVRMAAARGLDVQFELGKKAAGSFGGEVVDELLEQGRRWREAGAVQLVVEARESGVGVGLFDAAGAIDLDLADRFAGAFGLDTVVFEAPSKPSQFALLDHFGPAVRLGNVRLEEVLRVEIYRRGLHSDAFAKPNLRPAAPSRGGSGRTFVIDCFPDSAARYRNGHAVVAVDVIRATTTVATAVAAGRRCIPVRSLEEAAAWKRVVPEALLAGEIGGYMPYGFDLDNSPAALAARDDHERPIILISSAGTQLVRAANGCAAVYVACLRNVAAQVAALAARHDRVALIGAGARGEFRDEDQLCCARLGLGLQAAGFEPADDRTAEIVERWREAPVAAIARGASADYLRRAGHTADLEFVLTHVDDLDAVYVLRGDEVVEIAADDAARPVLRASTT